MKKEEVQEVKGRPYKIRLSESHLNMKGYRFR
jgi:hypothetical protein